MSMKTERLCLLIETRSMYDQRDQLKQHECASIAQAHSALPVHCAPFAYNIVRQAIVPDVQGYTSEQMCILVRHNHVLKCAQAELTWYAS
jgi:hypothetical protein